MTKDQAQLVIDLIHVTELQPESIKVEKVIQSAVDKYIDNLLKDNPKLKYKDIKSATSRKTNNFIRPFEIAFSNKLKMVLEEYKNKLDLAPITDENRFLIKEVAKKLEMTPQNLNHLLRSHPEINVIEVSNRKRYLTESEIEKVKRI